MDRRLLPACSDSLLRGTSASCGREVRKETMIQRFKIKRDRHMALERAADRILKTGRVDRNPKIWR